MTLGKCHPWAVSFRIQRVNDEFLAVQITWIFDGGFDFAVASYMDWPEIGTPLDDLQSFIKPKARMSPSLWHSCGKAGELAEAIHKAVLEKYPESDYAKLYARPN